MKVILFTEIPIGSKTLLHTKLVLWNRKSNCRIFRRSCLKTSRTKSILITYNYAILLFSSSRLDNSLADLLRRLFTPQFEQGRPDLLPSSTLDFPSQTLRGDEADVMFD
jgi:hypothetical protein